MTITPCYLHTPPGVTTHSALSGINHYANEQGVVLTADEDIPDVESRIEDTRIYRRRCFEALPGAETHFSFEEIGEAVGSRPEVLEGVSYGVLILDVPLPENKILRFRQGDDPDDHSVEVVASEPEQAPLKIPRHTPIIVDEQGGCDVNDQLLAIVESEGPGVVALSISMRTKRGHVAGHISCSTPREDGGYQTVPGIFLEPSEDSRHLNPNPTHPWTSISFPGFIGYSVWSAEYSRYTVYVCLVKLP